MEGEKKDRREEGKRMEGENTSCRYIVNNCCMKES